MLKAGHAFDCNIALNSLYFGSVMIFCFFLHCTAFYAHFHHTFYTHSFFAIILRVKKNIENREIKNQKVKIKTSVVDSSPNRPVTSRSGRNGQLLMSDSDCQGKIYMRVKRR